MKEKYLNLNPWASNNCMSVSREKSVSLIIQEQFLLIKSMWRYPKFFKTLYSLLHSLKGSHSETWLIVHWVQYLKERLFWWLTYFFATCKSYTPFRIPFLLSFIPVRWQFINFRSFLYVERRLWSLIKQETWFLNFFR